MKTEKQKTESSNIESSKAIKLSVRKIVEHIYRSGDIDSRYTDSDVMYEGIRAHKKIQRAMKTIYADYQAEMKLVIEADFCGLCATISGRADGVFTSDGMLTVHEIKTTTIPIEHLYQRESETHLAQCKYYAYILASQQPAKQDTQQNATSQKAEQNTTLQDAQQITTSHSQSTEAQNKLQNITQQPYPQQMRLRLTYFNMDTEETAEYDYDFSYNQLKDFFENTNKQYASWLHLERDWTILRNTSIKSTVFPHPSYRKGQREMAVYAYQAIKARRKLYAQAPTGIGKTLSAIFPSVKAIGEELAQKIFYLTAKTITRTVAESSIALMQKSGLRLKSITLRAKDKICFCQQTLCNPTDCPYAKGHYSRVNNALLDVLGGSDLITPAVIEEYAQKHCVCPYELSLDIALWADIIICDYNYVFDPTVYLRRFFADDTDSGEYVFLVDEAHNLPDRVRDMYTASINSSDFSKIKRELRGKASHIKALRSSSDKIATYLKDKTKEVPTPFSNIDKDSTLFALTQSFSKAAEAFLEIEKNSALPILDDVLGVYFNTRNYQGIYEMFDQHYISLIESESGDISSTLYCLDPSEIISKKLCLAKSTIMFSATLTPLPYYRELMGGNENDDILELDSPFEQTRLLLLGQSGISTKYAHREASIEPIVNALHSLAARKTGNYLAYFPSYEYLKTVYKAFTDKYPDINTLLQQGAMSETEREEFLSKFSADNNQTLIGFSVLGGIFSEGIDLQGERLIGSFIVGVGLPKISFRQELIKNYFDKTNRNGYDYAYVFPGMNKVMQAAGRVIRSDTDYGAVILIDTRFNTSKYKALFPSHWSHIKMVRTNSELEKALKEYELFN